MINVHNRQTLIFLLLSYGITWLIWLPLFLNRQFGAAFPALPFQYYLGPLGPLIAGLLTTLITNKKGETKDYVKKIFRFPKEYTWYLFALGTPWIAFIISAIVKKVLFGEFPGIEHFMVKEIFIPENLIAAWVLWIFSFGLGEEAGWRGFLFQHFLKRRAAFRSSLLTSIFWAAWHLPVFFFDENFQQMAGFGAVGWLIGIVSGSILLSWMTLNAGGSVIPAILWHGTFNTIVAGTHADPFISGFCSMVVVVAAIYLRLQFGPNLQIKREKTIFSTKEIEQ